MDDPITNKLQIERYNSTSKQQIELVPFVTLKTFYSSLKHQSLNKAMP